MRRLILPFSHYLRALSPGAAVPVREGVRASFGALLGIAATVIVAMLISQDLWLAVYLVAPFGSSSVLLYAAPNSPLAQPWPAIVGNTVSALAAIAVCIMVPDPVFNVPLSVAAAILAMALCRAMHPPGGAVAMMVAIGAETIIPFGFGFAFVPVALGTAVLVVVAAMYAPLTGRRYPLRQFNEPNAKGTLDPAPEERLGLSEDELAGILARYKQSLNLGVEDLARLIGAAELQAASHRVSPQTAADIMSRDLVTVSPDAPLQDVVSLFIQYGFTSLPVVENGKYEGVIFQLDLIEGSLGDRSPQGARRLLPNWAQRRSARRARDIMKRRKAAQADTRLAALLPILASHRADAVPVLDDGQIVGIVTQTDLISALARQSLRAA